MDTEDVRSVASGVGVLAVVNGVEAPLGTALEFLVRDADSSINNVIKGTLTCAGVVDIIGSAFGARGEHGKSPLHRFAFCGVLESQTGWSSRGNRKQSNIILPPLLRPSEGSFG